MPYANEHSARLRNPKDFDKDTFRRTNGGTIYGRVKVPKTIGIIWGKLKGKADPDDPVLPQALRFPTKKWSVKKAKDWLKKNNVKYILFEPAKGGKSLKDKGIGMERRFVAQSERSPIIIQRAEGESPKITGLAAVYYDGTPETEFELWAHTFERIMPGAFDRAIAEDDVRGLFNHNADNVLGRTAAKTLKLRSNNAGLDYEVDVGDTQIGRDVMTHIDRKDVTGSSFAFRVISQTWREEEDRTIREINEVILYDVGPVTYPAYKTTSAGLRSVSEDGMAEARDSYETWQSDQAGAKRAAFARSARARAVEISD